MRDKQAVEAYKANLKAKLTRVGLIRGQPQTSMLQAHAAKPAPALQLPTFHRLPAPSPKTSEKSPSTASSSLALDVDLRPFDYRFDPPGMGGTPGIPNIGSSSGFHQLPATSYSNSYDNSMDFGTPTYQYSRESSPGHSEPLDFDMGLYIAQDSNDQFDFNIRPPSPIQNFPLLAGKNSIQESHITYFFEHVRKTKLPFSSNALTNLTYTMIVQEPRGAVTNAVCALSSLHLTHMLFAQGLKAPEHSTAQHFYDEATFQLASGKQAKSRYAESDVLAALYLLCFSQMAGCTNDWRPILAIAIEFIAQTGLPTGENLKVVFANMSTSSQLIVKCTMWMDIFASFTLMEQPKYLALYKCLLDDQNGFWGRGLHMEHLTGCPDEAMLALAEISGLAHWKTSEQAKGPLNFPELVWRGNDIEQRLRNRQREPSNFGETPLDPNLMQTAMSDAGAISYSDEVMQLVGNVFRESALLYLHTIINDDNPAVPEIAASVNTIIQLLHELEPSEIDRTLVFPVCLAGCMTSNSSHRDLLKSRLQLQDESIGNLLQTRLMMEAVWQKRGESGSNACEWREILRERCPNLLLI
ncbi:fungal-specific transcription factor domain-containing protein [Armillaria nabsnona]|nr:fungal-specific transcription factor domain-containing protein [Armillaria nabsnona]